jgi:putative phosphoesterase
MKSLYFITILLIGARLKPLIAIFSDIHDHAGNLQWLLSELQLHQPQALICCGDMSTAQTLSHLAELGRELHFCLGNTDEGQAQAMIKLAASAPHLHFGGKSGQATFGRRRVAYTHYPERAAQIRDVDAVFFGHSHRRYLSTDTGLLLANPGDIQNRYGDGPSYLLWDPATNQGEFVVYPGG